MAEFSPTKDSLEDAQIISLSSSTHSKENAFLKSIKEDRPQDTLSSISAIEEPNESEYDLVDDFERNSARKNDVQNVIPLGSEEFQQQHSVQKEGKTEEEISNIKNFDLTKIQEFSETEKIEEIKEGELKETEFKNENNDVCKEVEKDTLTENQTSEKGSSEFKTILSKGIFDDDEDDDKNYIFSFPNAPKSTIE